MRRTLIMLGLLVGTLLISGTGIASAQTPDQNDFRQDPTIDFRSVVLDITTDTDAQFEIVIANPTLNDDKILSGELIFRVPPGVTIYSSLLGGTGGTGIIQAPFTQDPIAPGGTKVFTFFARSTEVGNVAVFSSVSYWPQDHMELAQSVNRQFPITVREPSKLEGLPQAIQEELGTAPQQTAGGSSSGSFSMSSTDNPLGWPNWFVIMLGAMIIILVILVLGYRLLRARIPN